MRACALESLSLRSIQAAPRMSCPPPDRRLLVSSANKWRPSSDCPPMAAYFAGRLLCWPPTTAYFWPPTTLLAAAAYAWPPTPGRLLLAAYSWQPTPGDCLPPTRLPTCTWSLAHGRLLPAAFHCPPTAGRLLSGREVRAACYWPPSAAMLAAYFWPPSVGRLLLAAYYWRTCHCLLLDASCRLLLAVHCPHRLAAHWLGPSQDITHTHTPTPGVVRQSGARPLKKGRFCLSLDGDPADAIRLDLTTIGRYAIPLMTRAPSRVPSRWASGGGGPPATLRVGPAPASVAGAARERPMLATPQAAPQQRRGRPLAAYQRRRQQRHVGGKAERQRCASGRRASGAPAAPQRRRSCVRWRPSCATAAPQRRATLGRRASGAPRHGGAIAASGATPQRRPSGGRGARKRALQEAQANVDAWPAARHITRWLRSHIGGCARARGLARARARESGTCRRRSRHFCFKECARVWSSVRANF